MSQLPNQAESTLYGFLFELLVAHVTGFLAPINSAGTKEFPSQGQLLGVV